MRRRDAVVAKFPCNYCDLAFKDSRSLKCHTTMKHKAADVDEVLKHDRGVDKSESIKVGEGMFTHAPKILLRHWHSQSASPLLEAGLPVRKRLNLPRAGGEEGKWKEIDRELEVGLELQLGRNWSSMPIDVMVEALNDAAWVLLHKTVGDKACSQPISMSAPKRRPKIMAKLRRSKREMRREWRCAQRRGADIETMKLLKSQWNKVMRIHNQMRKLEIEANEAETVAKAEGRFRRNPFRYAKSVLTSSIKRGKPTFGADKAFEYFQKAYADVNRGHLYEIPEQLAKQRPSAQVVPFNGMLPSRDEVNDTLRRKSNSSAPGPNGLPYLAYKRLPSLQRRLQVVVERVWQEKAIPRSWQMAVIILLSKTDELADPVHFRPIALTNTDAKIFFTILQKRFTAFMMSNAFFSVSVQKAFLPGISGCIEHNQLLYDVLRQAKAAQRRICVSWLDMMNAYGSVRHNLIGTALAYYHFPEEFIELVFSYYDRLVAKVSTDTWETDTFAYEIGVFQGCTLSTVLFNIVFNLLHEWLKNIDVQRFTVSEGISLREQFFADDITLVTEGAAEHQRLLDGVDEFLRWTNCMKAKPSKCRSLAITSFTASSNHRYVAHQNTRYSSYDPKLTVSGSPITFIADEPFKHLGRKLYATLTDEHIKEEVLEKLKSMLKVVDDLPVRGTFKLYIYNVGVIPRLSWHLLVYDFTLTFLTQLEELANSAVKKWAGVSRYGTNPILLYLPRKKGGLGIVKLTFFAQRLALVREHLLKYSRDPVISRLAERRLQVATDNCQRKWQPAIMLRNAERGLILDSMTAAGQTTLAGVGYGRNRHTPLPKEGTREHRLRLTEWTAERDCEEQMRQLGELAMQADWLKWDGVMRLDLSWNTVLYRLRPSELKFYLQAMNNVAPTPAFLSRFIAVGVDPTCCLCCKASATLAHIVSNCQEALERYKWRHNEILRILHYYIGREVRRVCQKTLRPVKLKHKMTFVKAGQAVSRGKREAMPSLLEQANDWHVTVDLPSMTYQFPRHIAVTQLRPDLVIWSDALKVVIMLELTVPHEGGLTDANKRKAEKYAALRQECTDVGWRVELLPVEVGVFGHVGLSMQKACRMLGAWSKKMEDTLAEIALRCSYAIFVARKTQHWTSTWRMWQPTSNGGE